MPRLLGAQKVIAFNGTEKVIAFYVEMYYNKDSIGRVGARVWAMGPSAGGTGSCPPDERRLPQYALRIPLPHTGTGGRCLPGLLCAA